MFRSVPVPVVSSTPCEPIWPPPADLTVQTDPELRAVSGRWNCAVQLLHFFSVLDGGQVCVSLFAVALSFSPSLCIINIVVLTGTACGDEPAWKGKRLTGSVCRDTLGLSGTKADRSNKCCCRRRRAGLTWEAADTQQDPLHDAAALCVSRFTHWSLFAA